jgi:hypothetical protein
VSISHRHFDVAVAEDLCQYKVIILKMWRLLWRVLYWKLKICAENSWNAKFNKFYGIFYNLLISKDY